LIPIRATPMLAGTLGRRARVEGPGGVPVSSVSVFPEEVRLANHCLGSWW